MAIIFENEKVQRGNQAVRRISRGKIDLAIAQRPRQMGDGFPVLRVYREEYVVAGTQLLCRFMFSAGVS